MKWNLDKNYFLSENSDVMGKYMENSVIYSSADSRWAY
jgi:hypothetical protein